jgi:molybdopterin synthase sulfur carrier subunit
MVNVKIPTLLRRFTNQQGEVQIEGNTIIEIIDNLEKSHPGIKKRLLDETGKVRKFINIYVGDEDIRFLQKEETKIEGKEVSIVPAIAGG